RKRRLVDAATVAIDAFAGARPQALERPARARNPDDWHLEVPAPRHRVQRGEDLLVRKVAGGAEENEGVGTRLGHFSGPFSTRPRNSKRMADSSRSWKSASPRELKRSKSAAASTCAGTASDETSYTTHSWPPRMRRRVILAPIRPRPIIPICVKTLRGRARATGRPLRVRPARRARG